MQRKTNIFLAHLKYVSPELARLQHPYVVGTTTTCRRILHPVHKIQHSLRQLGSGTITPPGQSWAKKTAEC
jgi:hypothetical protein